MIDLSQAKKDKAKTSTTTLYLDPSVLGEFSRYCKEHGYRKSKLVELLMASHLIDNGIDV